MYGGEMKRQKSMKSDIKYTELLDANDDIPMQRTFVRKEPTIEAQILENDTLQAIALRYNCTLAEIKRLNKIDKDNEIHARSVILIPATLNSMLVPSLLENKENLNLQIPFTGREQLSAGQRKIDLTNSNSSNSNVVPGHEDTTVNDIILNTKLKSTKYMDNDQIDGGETIESDHNDNDVPTRLSHPIVLKRKHDLFDFSGSDCDISWICLLFGILALCVAIPLIYIIYIAEHPEKFHHKDDKIGN